MKKYKKIEKINLLYAIYVFLISFTICTYGCQSLGPVISDQLDLKPAEDLMQALTRTPGEWQTVITRSKTEHHQHYQMGKLSGSFLENRMQTMAKRIISISHYPELPIELKIIEGPPDAFTTGGKYVYISTGLITEANTQDEIAYVMGHEIAHIMAGHSTSERSSGERWAVILSTLSSLVFKGNTAQSIIKNGRDYLTGAYSRRDEREADILGTVYTQKAGYDALRGGDLHLRWWKKEKKNIGAAERTLRSNYASYSRAKMNFQTAVNMCKTYQVYNPSYANSYYYSSVLPAKQKYEAAGKDYIRICKQYEHTIRQVSPLFRSHPPAPERVKLISNTVKALEDNKQRRKDELLYVMAVIEEAEYGESQPRVKITSMAYLEQLKRKLIIKGKIGARVNLILIYYRGDYVFIKAIIPSGVDRIFLFKEGELVGSYTQSNTRKALEYFNSLTNIEMSMIGDKKLLLEEGDYRILWKKSSYYLVKNNETIKKYGSKKLDQVLLDLTLITEKK